VIVDCRGSSRWHKKNDHISFVMHSVTTFHFTVLIAFDCCLLLSHQKLFRNNMDKAFFKFKM